VQKRVLLLPRLVQQLEPRSKELSRGPQPLQHLQAQHGVVVQRIGHHGQQQRLEVVVLGRLEARQRELDIRLQPVIHPPTTVLQYALKELWGGNEVRFPKVGVVQHLERMRKDEKG
jgi:hypothetical protein